jgi:hypothetical protein
MFRRSFQCGRSSLFHIAITQRGNDPGRNDVAPAPIGEQQIGQMRI